MYSILVTDCLKSDDNRILLSVYHVFIFLGVWREYRKIKKCLGYTSDANI